MPRASAIPERWTDYLPVGKQIEGTRFICFKVPLRSAIINDVDENYRLDSVSLLKTVPNLGLIIDLTDTFRYYDPEIFESKGLIYKKIRIPGQTIPQQNLVEVFKRHVQEYLKNNEKNDKLIGVHCTHGVNRTGYLVCNYMISVMTLSAEEAIKKFDEARGHKIERENYLRDLRELESHYKYKRLNQRRYIEKRKYSSSMYRSDSFGKEKRLNHYEDRWNSTNSRRGERKYNEHNSACSSYRSSQRFSPYENTRHYRNIRSDNKSNEPYNNNR